MSNLFEDSNSSQQVDGENGETNTNLENDSNKSDANRVLSNLESLNKTNQPNYQSRCTSQHHHHHHHHSHLHQTYNTKKSGSLQNTYGRENQIDNSSRKNSIQMQEQLQSLMNTMDSNIKKLAEGNKVNGNHNLDRDLGNINLGYQNGSLISLYNTSNQLNGTSGNPNTVTHTLTLSKSNGTYPNHCHTTDFEEAIDKSARKKLLIASVLCLLFMIGETVGGLLSNSLAIATDAAHLLTDFASFMISLFSIWLASRPASKKMSFGYYRAEVIGALTSVLLIWVVTGVLVMMAIQRLATSTFDLDARIMLITAAIGVFVNVIMGLSLQIGGVPHGHHGHSHHHHHHHNNSHYEEMIHSSDTHSSSSSHVNLNVRAAFIHVVGDFIQSLGVMVAAIVIYFYPNLQFIDPICTFFFSILVLFTTFNIIRDVINVLMEGIPKGIDFLEVQKTLLNIPGVIKVHNLRVWSLSLDKIALSVHLVIGKNQDPKHILLKSSKLIKDKFKIFDLTIQVEEYKDEMKDCNQCNPPNFYSENSKLLKK